MSKKRQLTPEEVAAAETLDRAIKASGRSQDAIGADLGVTQGQIWQWSSARLRVPAHRAAALAAAVGGVTPEQISPAYAKAIRPGSLTKRDGPAPDTRPQTDVDALRIAIVALYETFIENERAKVPVLRRALIHGVENPKDLQRGFLGQLMLALDEAILSAAADHRDTPPRAAS